MTPKYKSPLGVFASNLAMALLFAAPLFAADDTQDTPESPTNTIAEAYHQFETGKPELALEGFNRALELDANNLLARLGQAMVFQAQQRHEEAFTSFDLVVQKQPGHIGAWNGRGLAAFNLENFDDALASFQQATADEPVNGFFYESLAWTHLCRGDYSEAATTARQATLMYNQNGETVSYPLLIAYFSYLEEGKQDEALRTLTYAENNKPASGAWPTPVFEYLSGRLDIPGLISFVTNTAEETEAHTYIGLHLRSQEDFDAANTHLDWVASKGDTSVFEQMLARTLQASNKVALLAQ